MKLPNDIQAEKSLLGCLLVDSSKIVEVEDKISEKKFHDINNGKIYRAILALISHNKEIDIITISRFLESKEILKSVGGRAYIAELATASISGSLIKEYANIIADCYSKRELIKITHDLKESDIENVDSYISRLQDKLSSIDTGIDIEAKYNINDLLTRSYEIRASRKEGIIGYKTGIPKLDRIILGQQKGHYGLIDGYNSHGKSTVLVQLMANALMDGAKCLCITLESGQVQVVNKTLANLSKIPTYNFKLPTSTDTGKAYDLLMDKPLSIVHGVFDIHKIVSTIKYYNRKGLVDCVYIDYAQLITSNDLEGTKLLDYCAGIFQQLAISENIFVGVASQISNEAVKNVSMASGSRGSSQLSASSDWTIQLMRELDKVTLKKTDYLGLLLKKQRDGGTGLINCKIDEEVGLITEVIN